MNTVKRVKVKDLLNSTAFGSEVMVKGWVRTFRNNQFIAINDGSTINNIQAVVDFSSMDEALLKRITTGAAISITGELIESLGKGQRVEVKVKHLEIVGDSDAEKFPLQPKKHSLEFLREIAHLRFRTNTFNAVFKVRHALGYAIHKFFNDRGFVYLHTPIISASDAEGAGELFTVTSLDLKNIPFDSQIINAACEEYKKDIINCLADEDSMELIKEINTEFIRLKLDFNFEKLIDLSISEMDNLIKLGVHKNEVIVENIKKLYLSLKNNYFERNGEGKIFLPKKIVDKIEKGRNPVRTHRLYGWGEKYYIFAMAFYNFSFIQNSLRTAKDSKVDFKQDFFGKSTNLTVSGQLEAELAAMAFGEVYTFGPTFRAENSNTTRHLAEFWMIEPEVAFADLSDNMQLAEDLLKYVIHHAMETCKDELEFLKNRLLEEEKTKPMDERSELDLITKLNFCLANDFERLTYTEAIEILKNSNQNKKKKFKYLIDKWGVDLQSEHERYLVEKHFKKPVILTDYPKDIKAFYMRINDDGTTVRAMDILFPGIGEIVGGSQREERLEQLEQRMKDMNIPADELYWYLDLRKFGTAPHAGFGLGFERLVLFVTGMTNIRDVMPFPRAPKMAEF